MDPLPLGPTQPTMWACPMEGLARWHGLASPGSLVLSVSLCRYGCAATMLESWLCKLDLAKHLGGDD